MEQKTSQKPITISWIIDNKDCKFGIHQCPGKVMEQGRNGKKFERNLQEDIINFKERGVGMIVCLLNKYELRTIGVDLDKYKQFCQKYNINLIEYPLIEMSVPVGNMQTFHNEIILQIINFKNGSISCHCRGGIGRAGLIASCMILAMKIQLKTSQAIQLVRDKRDPRCVESQNQRDFIQKYENFLGNLQ